MLHFYISFLFFDNGLACLPQCSFHIVHIVTRAALCKAPFRYMKWGASLNSLPTLPSTLLHSWAIIWTPFCTWRKWKSQLGPCTSLMEALYSAGLGFLNVCNQSWSPRVWDGGSGKTLALNCFLASEWSPVASLSVRVLALKKIRF